MGNSEVVSIDDAMKKLSEKGNHDRTVGRSRRAKRGKLLTLSGQPERMPIS